MANDGVVITVRRIKEVSFLVNEAGYVPEPNKLLNIQVGIQLGFAIPQNLVTLIVFAFYHYPETPHEIIVNIQVQNIFEISDLSKYAISEVEIKLPPKTITRLVDLSVSHTRALLSKNLLGTVVQENVLPISDAKQMAMNFFPVMFDGAATADQEVPKAGAKM